MSKVSKLVKKAYKLRIYPTPEQVELINRTIGSSRYVYNYFLALRKSLYETEKKSISYNACSKELTKLKKANKWLREVDKFALQNSLKDLQAAYRNFFRELSKGNKKQGFPKFKRKHDPKQSYRTNFTNNNIQVDMENRTIKLPKLGWVTFRKSKKWTKLPGKILNVTVSRTPSNKYFVSVLVETEVKELPVTNKKIGIDLGLKDYAILSDGTVYSNPKHLEKLLIKLKRLQRRLSKKQLGSKNYYKARLKIARLHEKIANCRYDFLHKLSTKVVNENQVIAMEDLQVKNMVKNKNLARAISDAAWSTFVRMVKYKAEWYGRTFIQVSSFYPSSKLCNTCGTKNAMLTLSQREWQCPVCKTIHQRDINAARNILDEGLRLLAA